jgi:general secretion pathway protein G
VAARAPHNARGFTMLELMVVITIILILLGMAAGKYQMSIISAREAALRQDLFVLRQAIHQFTIDKLQAPQSLEDLVSAGYLREVPTDPMTNAKDWQIIMEDILLSPDQTGPGITDVRSSSAKISPFTSEAYNSW